MHRRLFQLTLFTLAGAIIASMALLYPTATVAPLSSNPTTSAYATSRPAGESLGEGKVVGKPAVFDNLTIFPILSTKEHDIGPVVTLATALQQAQAEVREVGADSAEGSDVAGEVGKLVIENKGAVAIYVLAGTVVKGGKQDRQIGQDFIIAAHKTVEVDAFCVEHGRWTASRDGAATYGQFTAADHIANANVRAAGQYGRDQGKVWSEVAKVNAASDKEPGSGTLLATLDDQQIAAKRAALAARVEQHLRSAQQGSAVVGFAYAVDGEIRAVRWFTHRNIFSLFRPSLVDTAALDAITAQAGRPPKTPPRLAAAAVTSFITQIRAAKDRRVAAPPGANNTNEYRAAESLGGGSKTMAAPLATAAGTAAASAPVVVSEDYVAH